MKKSVLIGLAVALIICLAAISAQVYANHVIRKQVEEYIADLPPDVLLEIEKARYSLIGKRARISGISFQSSALSQEGLDTIRIDDVLIYRYDTENTPPHFAHMEFNGITIPGAFTDGALLEMERMGLSGDGTKDLKIDAQSRYRFDPDRREFVASRNDVQIRGLAGAQLKFHLDDIDPALFQQQADSEINPFMLIAAIGKVRLVSADIFLEVGTLTDRIFQGLAEKRSIPVENLKEQLASIVSAEIEAAPGVSEETGRTILDFIREPGDVRITLAPEKPLSVMEALNLSEQQDLLIKALNIRIRKL